MYYFGHIVAKDSDNPKKLFVTGKVSGKRPRRHSPIRWLRLTPQYIASSSQPETETDGENSSERETTLSTEIR